jgi:hypothetical protein
MLNGKWEAAVSIKAMRAEDSKTPYPTMKIELSAMLTEELASLGGRDLEDLRENMMQGKVCNAGLDLRHHETDIHIDTPDDRLDLVRTSGLAATVRRASDDSALPVFALTVTFGYSDAHLLELAGVGGANGKYVTVEMKDKQLGLEFGEPTERAD